MRKKIHSVAAEIHHGSARTVFLDKPIFGQPITADSVMSIADSDCGNRSEIAVINMLFCKFDYRPSLARKRNRKCYSVFFNCFFNFAAVFHGAGKSFFGKNMLTRFCRTDKNILVHCCGSAAANGVDIAARKQSVKLGLEIASERLCPLLPSCGILIPYGGYFSLSCFQKLFCIALGMNMPF